MPTAPDRSNAGIDPFAAPQEATHLSTVSAWVFFAFVTAAGLGLAIAFRGHPAWPTPYPIVSVIVLAAIVAVASTFASFRRTEGLAEVASLAMPVDFAMLLVLEWRFFVIAIALGELIRFAYEYARKLRPTAWYIRIWNVCSMVVSGAAAESVLRVVWVSPGAGVPAVWSAISPAVALLAAAFVWKSLDSIADTMMVTLAAKRHVGSMGVRPRVFLSQFALFLIAIPFARVWAYDPWVSLFALAPLGAAYRLLSLPELEHRAVTDARTGLTNAGAFDAMLQDAVRAAASSKRELALLAIDIDHFKRVNDTFGHLAGDCVIARFGQILASTARKDDVAARTGGEEFALLLPGADRSAAIAFADRLRNRIEETKFEATGVDEPIPLTTSIGVALFPDDGVSAKQLFAAADQALYRAKNVGRNTVCVAEEKLEASGFEAPSSRVDQPIDTNRGVLT